MPNGFGSVALAKDDNRNAILLHLTLHPCIQRYLELNLMVKNGGEEEEYVSLRLEMAQSSVKPDIIIEASFIFVIYDQSYGKHRKHQVITHSFQTTSTSSGTSRMIALNTLEESSQFLINNSCIFGIEFLKVATVKAKTTSETLFVQEMNIFNKAKVHTWEIEDLYALKNPDYSPKFEVGGYTWFIRMRPSYDGNYLSIFLKMKKSDLLSKDSANLVEVTLSIKDQESDKNEKFSNQAGASSQTALVPGDGRSSSH